MTRGCGDAATRRAAGLPAASPRVPRAAAFSSRATSPRGSLSFFRAAGVLGTLALGACALPRWPAQGPITSPYGLRMVGWSPEVHRGVDIAVPDGTPVVAMAGGSVVYAGTQTGYGTVVVLRHHWSTRTVYGHLSALRVRTGDHVNAGQVIALSGHSGNARGPHLHFEVQRWGEAEDPVPLLGGHP